MKGNFKKGISVALSLALTVSSFALPDTAKNVNAENSLSIRAGNAIAPRDADNPDIIICSK